MPNVSSVFSIEERAPFFAVRWPEEGASPKPEAVRQPHAAHRLGMSRCTKGIQRTDFPQRPPVVLHVCVQGGSPLRGGVLQTGSGRCRDRTRCSRPAR